MNTTIRKFILDNVDTSVGVGTIGLYEQGYSVRSINATIREMIDNGDIAISCPVAGFLIYKREGWDAKGCEVSLRTKDFYIKRNK